jgi:hypothetical protein
MNLETVSRKQLNDIEIRVRELLKLMRKAKLHDETVTQLLAEFEQTLADARRKRFEEENSEYQGY